MDKFWKAAYFVLGGALFIGIITHPKGFATAAGTLFAGGANIASTLEAGNIKTG